MFPFFSLGSFGIFWDLGFFDLLKVSSLEFMLTLLFGIERHPPLPAQILWVKGEQIKAAWDLESPVHAFAIALYITSDPAVDVLSKIEF